MSAPPLPRPRTVEHGEPPPAVRMVQMLAGFQVSEALYAVAKLGVATSLTDGPRSVGELARTLGAHETALRRLLRDLTGFGLFTSVPPDSYALTPLGATLAAGQPGSVRDLALTWMETHYAPFGDLLTTVRTGEPAASRFYGQPFFDWLSADPEQVARFTGAMADLTDGIKAGAVAGYRVPGGPVVVDVGGADGALLQTVLAADPDPARQGVVLDLPHVVPAAHARLAGSPLADRIDVVAGDFFAAVPTGDTYLLSMVLHDWDDDAALRLLRTVAAAARPGARLVALELVLPDDDRPHLSRAIDLTMLGMLGGRERTAAEFDSLLGAAGFRLDRVAGTPTPISIVEATLTG